MTIDHLQKINICIREAGENGLLMQPEGLSGYSGSKLMGSMQRLAKATLDSNNCYLEVGIFQGMTLLSVASAVSKEVKVFGIDNFAFFDPEKKNLSIVKERRKNLALDNALIINMDYEDALLDLNQHIGNRKVGVYFVDGPHDYRSQLISLLLIKPFLSENAIIIVDDCNYRHVRQANCDFLLSHPEFKLLFEAYTPCHPKNMDEEQRKQVEKGWWNGVNIIVKDKGGLLKPMYPPTYRSRDLYENEHQIHAFRFPESTQLGCLLAEHYATKNLRKIIRTNINFYKAFKNQQERLKRSFLSMNTYSAELPKENWNEFVYLEKSV